MSRRKNEILKSADDFKPFIGRIRVTKKSRQGGFLKALRKLAKGYRLGKKLSTGQTKGASPSRIRHEPKSYSQRVTVKGRFVNLQTKGGVTGVIRHIRYLQREGVSETGDTGILYNKEGVVSEKLTPKSLDDWKDDKHYWRFIVSPEFGSKIDLNTFSKDLISGMENDLGTRLSYYYVPHYNTDKPHVHIIVRGVRDDGKPLILSKDFVSHGIRFLAQEIATKQIGHRLEKDVINQHINEVKADRFVTIDRFLVKAALQGQIDLRKVGRGKEAMYRNLKIARLKHLRELGLSREVKAGIWVLKEGMEDTLKKMALRGDILKTIHSVRHNSNNDFSIINETNLTGKKLIKVFHIGLADEANDTRYLLSEGLDGQTYYLNLSKVKTAHKDEIRIGNVLEVYIDKLDQKSVIKTRNLSSLPLDKLALVNGVTLLDRLLAQVNFETLNGNFGTFNRELKAGIDSRIQFLKSRGEIVESGIKEGFIDRLYLDEIKVEGPKVTRQFGELISISNIVNGDYSFKGYVEFPSGKHAIFYSDRGVTFVPYKEEMENLKEGGLVNLKVESSKRISRDLTIAESAEIKFKALKPKFIKKGGKKR